ncbi:unnamed protein product, partial [Cylicocyclus nassatus]
MQHHFRAAALLVTVISLAQTQPCKIYEDGGWYKGLAVDTQNKVLEIVNKARQKLANGEQQNGSGGENLPKAKGIADLVWDCDLEQEASVDLYCHYRKLDDPIGKTGLFRLDADLYDAIEKWTTAIDTTALKDSAITAEEVMYEPITNALYEYANLVRDTTTKIGCSKACNGFSGVQFRAYCFTDQPPLTEDDAIYTIDPMSKTTTTTNAATTTFKLTTTTVVKEATTTKTSASTTTTKANATTKPSTTRTATEGSSIPAAEKTTSCIPRRKATTLGTSEHPQQPAVF